MISVLWVLIGVRPSDFLINQGCGNTDFSVDIRIEGVLIRLRLNVMDKNE